MNTSIKWGILGPGHIANQFAEAMQYCENSTIRAVASTSKKRAETFAQKHRIPYAYDDYAELLRDQEIDAIYIATINTTHFPLIQQCVAAHKPVLCEKPCVVTEQEVMELQKLSEQNNVLIMEGMWTRFLPAVPVIKDWMHGGKIGSIRNINMTFSFQAHKTQERLYSKELLGGGLFDVGVYCIAYALQLLESEPVELQTMVQVADSGVDEFTTLTMRFPRDILVNCQFGISVVMEHEAYIYGEKGKIYIPDFWCKSNCYCYDNTGNLIEAYKGDSDHGFKYEITHFNNLIRNKEIQSDLMPLESTRKCAKIFDQVRCY